MKTMTRRGKSSATVPWWRLCRGAVAWVCVTLALGAQAQDYSDREEVAAILAEVGSAGVDVAWARELLTGAKRQQSILDAIARPAEKTKPWYDYRDIFLTDQRTREGVVFWDTHAAVLEEISQRTGVPSSVIVAIIGVETFYGRITGSYRVIDALTTLAFDYPRRSPFFTRELKQFLMLAWESGKDPLALKGSYAGAMGYGQFMPSSYRAYARSFEPGGVPDIWDNPADAISSVGHYLNAHGWQAGERVLLDAVASQPPDSLFAAGLKPSQSIEALARAGLSTEADIDPRVLVTPISLETTEGQRYWLGLQNFYVITRYNHSAMYAMAVWELSEAILAARPVP
jgi:membrane-bound lytic murein transglycosylase B